MLEVGEIVKLDDDKEYIVVNIMNLHNVRYVFVIATEKISGEDIVLEEVKDNEELDYVLSKFSLTKDED